MKSTHARAVDAWTTPLSRQGDLTSVPRDPAAFATALVALARRRRAAPGNSRTP